MPVFWDTLALRYRWIPPAHSVRGTSSSYLAMATVSLYSVHKQVDICASIAILSPKEVKYISKFHAHMHKPCYGEIKFCFAGSCQSLSIAYTIIKNGT